MKEDSRVRSLLEEALNSGRTPDDVCVDNPNLLDVVWARWHRIRALSDVLECVFPSPERDEDSIVASTNASVDLPRIPGYELSGIIGSGGMGVVYKARHIKLDRVVAVKMLRGARHASARESAGLAREARSIAAIKHPHIVQVHDIGELDGQPYFTMEYVEGGSLARKLEGNPMPAREAADLVAILADAVHTAHAAGIVHRDLKPANVLVDVDGSPKIADFGLARRTRGDARDTLSLTVVGTPSYMAPEQVLPTTDALGPTVDVYALGAVLYELLTGRPPFRADSHTETMRQVTSLDPVYPSRLNATVPRDLETICLKCLEKDSSRRYATAEAFGKDLRRFQLGEPISARPASPLLRLSKWIRRRPTQAALFGVISLSTTSFLILGVWFSAQSASTVRAVERDVSDIHERNRAWDWSGARAALERARARLGGIHDPSLGDRLERIEDDLETVARLERIRDVRAMEIDFSLGTKAILDQADRDYAEAMRSAGFAVPFDDLLVAANRIRESSVASALIAALDDWSVCTTNTARQAWLLDVAKLADVNADDWRRRVRDQSRLNDVDDLLEIARSANEASQSVQLLTVLGERIRSAGGDEVPFLTRVQEAHPDDYLANYSAGNALLRRKEFERATRYFQAAIALRPGSETARNNFALSLARCGQLDAAMSQYRSILRSNPQFAYAYQGLGNCHLARREYADAITQYMSALRIQPRSYVGHTNLGVMLTGAGRFDEARKHFQSALDIKPDYALAHCGLGSIARESDRPNDAIEHYREALRLNPTLVEGLIGLGASLRLSGDLDGSHDQLLQATGLDPENARAHLALGTVLLDSGQVQSAIDEIQTAIRLDSRLAPAYGALSDALITVGRFCDAETAANQGLTLLPANDSLRPQLTALLHIAKDKCPLEQLWPSIVSGAEPPRNPADCLELANIGYHKKHFATAARLFVSAFAADPQLADDLRLPYLYNAASVAALAGAGRGDDGPTLSEAERTKWREHARRWLRAWLTHLDRSTTDSQESRRIAFDRLRQLESDPDLAVLRDDNAMSVLQQSEADDCRALWTAVKEMIERFGGSQ